MFDNWEDSFQNVSAGITEKTLLIGQSEFRKETIFSFAIVLKSGKSFSIGPTTATKTVLNFEIRYMNPERNGNCYVWILIILDHNFTEKGLDLLKNQLVEEVGFSSHHSDQVAVEGKLLYFQSLQISVIRYFLSFPHLLLDKTLQLNSKKL